MPIYEYQCEHCSKEFERFQKISDAPLTTCPDCDGHVVRIVSRTSFSLKGGGWYKDGYASSSEKKEGKKKETSSVQEPVSKEKTEKKTTS